MPQMSVNVGGAWHKVKQPFVNVGGSWKKVKKAWTNVNGSWKLVYSGEFVYTVSASKEDGLDLDKIINDHPESDTIRVVINSGVTVSTRSRSYAIKLQNSHPSKVIILENHGRIIGAGGAGGDGGQFDSHGNPYRDNQLNGETGGIALLIRNPITIDNRGTIGGGGGGGGGGGAVTYIYNSGGWNTRVRGGGGGGGQSHGQGGDGGRGGHRGSAPHDETDGSDGRGHRASVDSYGKAGSGSAVNTTSSSYSGSGGRGGSVGENGKSGYHATIAHISDGHSVKGGNIGSGGRAGYSVDGNSHVTWANRGSLLGPTVN